MLEESKSVRRVASDTRVAPPNVTYERWYCQPFPLDGRTEKLSGVLMVFGLHANMLPQIKDGKKRREGGTESSVESWRNPVGSARAGYTCGQCTYSPSIGETRPHFFHFLHVSPHRCHHSLEGKRAYLPITSHPETDWASPDSGAPAAWPLYPKNNNRR